MRSSLAIETRRKVVDKEKNQTLKNQALRLASMIAIILGVFSGVVVGWILITVTQSFLPAWPALAVFLIVLFAVHLAVHLAVYYAVRNYLHRIIEIITPEKEETAEAEPELPRIHRRGYRDFL